LVVLGAVWALPPALMLLLRVAKLDLQAEGVVVVPSLQGGQFAFASVLIMAVLMLVGADLLRWARRKAIGRAKPTVSRCAVGILLGAGLFVALTLVSRGNTAVPHVLVHGLTKSTNGFGKALYLLSLVFVAPFAEESLFRGALEETLAMAFNPIIAIPLSALSFSISHGVWSMLLVYFIAGVMFSVLSYKSRSLLPAMVAHATFNTLTVAYIIVAA